MPKKKAEVYKGTRDFFDRKLERVMVRMQVDRWDYHFGRSDVEIEFWLGGERYLFTDSVERAHLRKRKIDNVKNLFAAIVLGLEDLARLSERGIYDFATLAAGFKALPEAPQVPSFLQFMGFQHVPGSLDEVRDRYKDLARQMHPDQAGNADDMIQLNDAFQQAEVFFS